jgi:hypothetical protein
LLEAWFAQCRRSTLATDAGPQVEFSVEELSHRRWVTGQVAPSFLMAKADAPTASPDRRIC